MNRSDKCWPQCHENSIPQLGQPNYRNVVTEPSQNNFFQQQNQPQSQLQQPKLQFQQSCNQSIQPQFTSYGMNAQGNCCAPPQQSCQPNLLYPSAQHMSNNFQAQYQQPCNPQPATMSQSNYGSLPPGVLEQIRSACITPTGPIFILPNNPPPTQQIQPQQQTMDQLSNCPGVRVPCGGASALSSPSPHSLSSSCYPTPSCFPYPIPMPIFNPFTTPITNIKEVSNCNCNSRRCTETCKPSNCFSDCSDEHLCMPTFDEAICLKQNCPSAINLQALASQLLAIPGIISCAATRLVLRKIAGSNITNSMEETIERARKSIHALTQDQLLAESRHAQQINALINLHMTANSPVNVIPILTTIQLKVNLLKSHVEKLINCNLMENQSIGAEGTKCLDVMALSLKCDQDLRTILATLRQKECDERVNLNFAPYSSQRAIAEGRLRNIESKIRQVEAEMARRRCENVPRFYVRHDDPTVSRGGPWYSYPGTLPYFRPFERETIPQPHCYESPDPFQIQVRNTRRLNLKPHVGSPETTYSCTAEQTLTQPQSIFTQNKQQNDNKNTDCEKKKKNSNTKNANNIDDDDDYDDCICSCDCSSKSSDDDSVNQDKKKLRLMKKKKNRVNNNEKKKTVDFVRENMLTDDIMNTIISSDMIMERPEKDTDNSCVDNNKNIELKKNKNDFSRNIVNKNIDDSYKSKIIFLHDSKLVGKPKDFKNFDMIDTKYSASLFELHGKNTLESQSMNKVENLTRKYSTNSISPDKKFVDSLKSNEILEDYFMDFIVDDSLNNIEKIDGIKLNKNELISQSNEIAYKTPDYNENEKNIEKIMKNNGNINSDEKKQMHHGQSLSSTLNPFPTTSRQPDVLSSINNNHETDDDFISSALSIIGNHVASFGSIIGKLLP
ncbi:hypothetical protein PV328_002139 [Microctonus aethiopoides]|uniref:Uncharacterized protein n=1 Tax=Microctonus aethiopoides TaxID=144406 RepID=A0AA39FYF5_9HYME|nr:hypothetical protein PV328_002139 [Microctonus aethiopoides]